MKGIIKYFVKYPVIGNAVYLAIMLFGLVAFSQIRTTFFPDIPPNFVYVTATYPGASPEELEEGVTLKIEDKLKGVTGIDRVTSVSAENSATVSVELKKGADANELLQEVTNAVDQISSFPAGLEKLQIYKQDRVDFVVAYALYGDVDLGTLKAYARRIERDLRNEGIASKVRLSGFPEEEIEISVSERAMDSYGITFAEIASAVNRTNLKITGGTIRGEREELLIRADNKGYKARDLENLVVRAGSGGAVVRLRDVAAVRDRWSEVPDRTWFNGKPSVTIDIEKSTDEDMFVIAGGVKEYMEAFDARHP
ncbi:MAG: efflux RND transporter permease subunit, partial [Chlorobium limicola]